MGKCFISLHGLVQTSNYIFHNVSKIKTMFSFALDTISILHLTSLWINLKALPPQKCCKIYWWWLFKQLNVMKHLLQTSNYSISDNDFNKIKKKTLYFCLVFFIFFNSLFSLTRSHPESYTCAFANSESHDQTPPLIGSAWSGTSFLQQIIIPCKQFRKNQRLFNRFCDVFSFFYLKVIPIDTFELVAKWLSNFSTIDTILFQVFLWSL